MTKEQKYLITFLTKHLVNYVMRDKNINIKEAFNTVCKSKFYTLLQDVETGLYRESPLYCYSYLQEELAQ